MKGALSCLALLTVVGTTHAQTTASAWFDLPVSGGERTLEAMGVSPVDRASALVLAARMPSGDESQLATLQHLSRAIRLAAAPPSPGTSEDDEPLLIPAPLTAAAWRELLALQPGEDLFARLLVDRAAALVAAGFMSTDASIRELALRNRNLLRRIYRETPGAFAVVARSLRLDGGRVVVPGGAGAEKIWDELAGESPSNAGAFIPALLQKDAGRLAWYFATLAGLDASRMEEVWPEGRERERLDTARALYESFRRVELRWRLEEQPFRRASGDPWMVLTLTNTRGGVVTGPHWQWLWDALFSNGVLDRRAATRLERRRAQPVSLTWLARALAPSSVQERREQFEMFRLAQRVFPAPSASDAADVAVAISGYRRYKSLLLALERMRIATPATWATLVEAALRVERATGNRHDTLASFQGGFALIVRMWQVGTLDTPAAERLVHSLAVSVGADGVPQRVGRWINDALMPALQPHTLLEALAGARSDNPPTIEWEGLEYRLDFAASERARLDRILALSNAPSLDEALAANDSSAIAASLKAIAYAVALGDPDGAVTLGPDIATRHDFGAATPVDELTAWATPVEMLIEGKPWHVRGSIVGLELGLARLSMRHLSGDQMPRAPTLTLNDYATLAQTAASMRPVDFTDADRDEIVAAIARGRQRVAGAGADLARLQALAREVDLSPSTRELLPWIVSREPSAVAPLFSLRDQLWLGNPSLSAERLDRWGMLAQAFDGRLERVMPRARAWEEFAGRADSGVMATQVPDLTLRLAEETARLRLPAALVPPMLSYAVQDYWYDVRARFADDWLAMTRHAASLPPERAEDYVAALAGTGLLRLREGQH